MGSNGKQQPQQIKVNKQPLHKYYFEKLKHTTFYIYLPGRFNVIATEWAEADVGSDQGELEGGKKDIMELI